MADTNIYFSLIGDENGTYMILIDPSTGNPIQLEDGKLVVVAEIDISTLTKDETLTNGTQITKVSDGSDTLFTEANPGNIKQIIPNTIISGKITVDVPGTPEPLATESTIVRKVYIKPSRANTDYVAVGDGDVDASEATEQGWSMSDEFPLVLEFADLADIYVDTVVAGEGITFIATAMSE